MKLVYDMPEGRIYQGHVLEVLRGLPAGSVHCCVTSPPYWGLRDYNLPDQVWGGLQGCDHEWGSELKLDNREYDSSRDGGGVGQNQESQGRSSIRGKFCQKCGAWSGCLGLEPTPELFVEHIVEIFREVRRVLRDDGTLWLNLGDSYAGNRSYQTSDSKNKNHVFGVSNALGVPDGLKPKDLCGIPWRVAFALQADGWYLRQDIIWHKPNPMPESVIDRCTKAHEYVFLLSKSPRYYFDQNAIKEPCGWDPSNTKTPDGWDTSTGNGGHGQFHKDGREKGKSNRAYSFNRKTATIGKPGSPKQHRDNRENIEYNQSRNKRSVWTVSTKPFKEAHFATFPPDLIEHCILAGCPKGGIVIDPFFGSGTTGIVAYNHDRKFIGIDLSEVYLRDISIPKIKYETQQLKLF